MKLLKYLILLLIISASPLSIVYSDLMDDSLKAIEDSYLAILSAEQVGGDVTVVIIMLNQALDMTVKGGEDNLREAIKLANEAKSLAFSIEQSSRTEQIYVYSRLLVFLIISFITIILIRKYGNSVYYLFWTSIKGNWRIKKV